METNRVKSMRSVEYAEKRLHYGIVAGTKLSIEHALSIILRCDWTDLCSKFTSTFRKSKPYELLSSVKSRNTEYAHFSRLIRETVEYFGQRGMGDYDGDNEEYVNQISGPFFCGMDHRMIIPQFNIRLNGPTSTTKAIEIAQRFGGTDVIYLLYLFCTYFYLWVYIQAMME